MTSIPASRSALAMILPPVVTVEAGLRDHDPDLPGHGAPVYGGAPDRHRLLACLAEPGKRPVGVPGRGRGGAPPRLRPGRPRPPPRARGLPRSIAITHFHLDHWGDLVPWAWLNAYGPQEHRIDCALWPAGWSRAPGGVRVALGQRQHVRRGVRGAGVRARRAIQDRGLRGQGLPAPPLRARLARIPGHPERDDARVLGRFRPDGGARGAGPRRRPVPLRGNLAEAPTTARPAAISPPPRHWQPPTGGSC